jgi:hypothetical protein
MARTTSRNGIAGNAGREAEQAVRSAARSPWVEGLARFGLAARGVVYVAVGILAFQAAIGSGGETTGAKGAIGEIAQRSRVLLALVAIGLFGYALWRILQAVLDPEGKGTDPKGLLARGATFATGLIYGGLALGALRIFRGASSAGAGGDDQGAQGFTAELMSKPFGRWLVALAGLGVIVYGCQQIAEGVREKFRDKLRLGEMSEGERALALRTGKIGLTARGVVFLILGGFLIRAAMESDPGEARGLGGALDALAGQPYGPWLLGLAALGLLAFGLYSLVEARYRRIYF